MPHKIQPSPRQLALNSPTDSGVEPFFGKLGGGTIAAGSGFAFNPGPANLQVIAGLLYGPRQFGPRNALGEDIIEKDIVAKLGDRAVFVDDWNYYHRLDGEVHCGSIVKHEVLDFDWWKKL